jgi:hypothetical protein
MLRDHCMQLVEDPVHGPFEPQHDRCQDTQVIAHRILFGNQVLDASAKEFQGDPIFAHATKMVAKCRPINPSRAGPGEERPATIGVSLWRKV